MFRILSPESKSDWLRFCLLALFVSLLGYGSVSGFLWWQKERLNSRPDETILAEDYGWEPIPVEHPDFPAALAPPEPQSWDDPKQVAIHLLRQHSKADIRAVADDIERGVLDVALFTGKDVSATTLHGEFETRGGVPTLLLQPALVTREGYRHLLPAGVPVQGLLPIKTLVIGHEARHYLQWRQSPAEVLAVLEARFWSKEASCTPQWTVEEEAWWEMCSEETKLGVHMHPLCDGAPGNRRAFDQRLVPKLQASSPTTHWYTCKDTWLRLAGHPAYQ